MKNNTNNKSNKSRSKTRNKKDFRRTKKTKDTLFKHCVKKAYRYGIYLDKQTYNILNNLAIHNCLDIIHQSNTITIRLVEYDNQKIAVVYDNKRKTICTLLPSDIINGNKLDSDNIKTSRTEQNGGTTWNF